jgi:hypothetical protein
MLNNQLNQKELIQSVDKLFFYLFSSVGRQPLLQLLQPQPQPVLPFPVTRL